MPWNSVSPIGSISVRANRTTMNQNTSYIETTMGTTAVGTVGVNVRDHFWNVGPNQDGRHRFIQSIGYTSGTGPAVPADPAVGTAMDGVIYLKQASVAVGRVEGFYRNTNGIYQFIPSYQTGTVNISGSTIQTIVSLPANVYGEIFFTKASDASLCCKGIFSSSVGQTRGFTLRVRSTISGSFDYAIELLNDASGGLNLRCREGDASSGAMNGAWTWHLTYRAQ